MLIYAAVSGVILFAIYKERQALGCPNIPDGSDCDNKNGKAVRGTYPSSSDATLVVADKIKRAADFADRWVTWRIALLSSIPCMGLIYFLIHRRVPNEHELVMGMCIITAIIYFVFNFYKFHLIDHARNNINMGVDILTSRM